MFSRDAWLRTHSKQNTFIDQCPSGEETSASTAGILREGQRASNGWGWTTVTKYNNNERILK